MGKKSRKKKDKRKQREYTKRQFVEILCRHCGLCGDDPDPSFCYTEMYKKTPKVFIDDVYTKLVKFRQWLKISPAAKFSAETSFLVADFRRIFCSSGICSDIKKTVCSDVLVCYESFRNQLSQTNSNEKGKKKRKKKNKVALRAYPTSFFSEDEQWRNLVKEILSDGS